MRARAAEIEAADRRAVLRPVQERAHREELVQGRLGSALIWFLVACVAGAVTWIITVGTAPFGWFVISIFACLNAAMYRR